MNSQALSELNHVASSQWFANARPCPICGSFAEVAQGKGEGCYGFLSTDGRWAHCTCDKHAGRIWINPDSGTYTHRIDGPCLCGIEHAAAFSAGGAASTQGAVAH